VSVKKSGSGLGSPTAAKSLDFSGQIVPCDVARSRALAFEEVSAEEILACFSSQHRFAAHQCLVVTCIVSRHGSTCLSRCPPQYLRLLIQDWRQECNMPSLTFTTLMSLGSTLETLCRHSSKLQE
jgi:hypothetical protein